MLAILLALAAAAPAAVPASPDEREIVRLELAWRQARIDGDTAFLERFYAPEFHVHTEDGRRVDRADDIGLFARRDIRPETIKPSAMIVQLYGDAALVTGIDDIVGSYKGHRGSTHYRFADMLVRRDGRWQLVLQQATPVPVTPAPSGEAR